MRRSVRIAGSSRRKGLPVAVSNTRAALFLVSDGSSYVNGVGLPVDGGLYATGVYSFARDKMDLREKVMNGENPAIATILERMKR